MFVLIQLLKSTKTLSNPLVHKCKNLYKIKLKDLIEFANASTHIDFEQNIIENDVNEKNSNKFEKMLEEDNINALMHNLLDVEHIVNDNKKSLTIVTSEG